MEDLRAELAETRRALERETVTAGTLDAAVSRAEAIAARLPAVEDGAEPAPTPSEPRQWQVGDRARSRSGGWEGRIAAMDKGGLRATLEAGGMRVLVDLDDLEPALGRPSPCARDCRWRRQHERDGPAARSGAQRGVVAGPARGPRRGGARGARSLPGRCQPGRTRLGHDHPRDGHRGTARRGPRGRRRRTRWCGPRGPGERGEGGDGATIVSL